MMTSSDGEAMKADAAPATMALPNCCAPVSSVSALPFSSPCTSLLVPNCDAVMGVMLMMFICSQFAGVRSHMHVPVHA